jgi:hypothetical protein
MANFLLTGASFTWGRPTYSHPEPTIWREPTHSEDAPSAPTSYG